MANFQTFPEKTVVLGGAKDFDKVSHKILNGTHKFAADNAPGLGRKLFAKVLGSPYAHAKVLSVDATKALAYPGVKAVITRKDIPKGSTSLPAEISTNQTAWSDLITCYGQFVAAVAAEDEDIADQACRLIDVKYEELPVVVELEDAKKEGSPIVGVYATSNVQAGSAVTRGDLTAGFAQADVVREYKLGPERNWTIRQLETNTSFAYWEGDDLYLWFGTQGLYDIRTALAPVLGIPQNKLHCRSYGSGGGFGRRGGAYVLISGPIAAVLAKKTGMPVLCRLDWFMDTCNTGDYPGHTMERKVGAKKDGTLTAIDCKVWAEACGTGVSYGTAKFQDHRNTFRIPNAKYQHFDVVTHKTHKASWRFHEGGGPCIEMGMDMFAADLGMSIKDFRLKNYCKPNEACQESKKPYSNYALEELTQFILTESGYDAKMHAPGARTLPDGRKHGIAFQSTKDTHSNISGRNGAAIFLTRDGKVYANCGLGRCGNGVLMSMCSIVAETLGVKYDDVTPAWGDSDNGSEGGNQGGSTRVMTLGAAMHMAALDARTRLFELAAATLKVDASTLEAQGGKIYVKTDPTKSVTHAEMAAKEVIIGKGYTWNKELQRQLYDWPAGTACENMSTCGMVVEVAVDTDTGDVEVLSVTNCDDIGKLVYRPGAIHGIIGAIDLNIAQAYWWENVFDTKTGVCLTPNQLDNPYVTTLDVNPDRWLGSFIQSNDASSVYGAIGIHEPIGESWTVFCKAIHNAIGVWIPEVPITPQKILKALGKG